MADGLQLSKLAKAGTVAGGAVVLSATSILCRTVIFQAKRVTGDNTNPVHIGLAGLNVGSAELIELAKGEKWEFPLRGEDTIDLADLWLDVETDTDGVVVLYAQA